MRRAAMTGIGVAALAAATAAPGVALATTAGHPAKKTKKKTATTKVRALTSVQAGTRLSTHGLRYEDTYRVKRSPFGEGTVIRDSVLHGTSFPATGSDTALTYDRGGKTVADETYTLGVPNTSGVGAIAGKGSCVKADGTGQHFNETCTYTFKGSYDLATGLTNITLSGTYTVSASAVSAVGPRP